MPRLRRARQRAVSAVRWRAARRLQSPSYTFKRLELNRTLEHLHALGERHPAFEVNDKDDAHRWAQSLGVRVPTLVGIYAEVGEVPWAELPERVVLKPWHGSSNRGVYLLERQGTSWRDFVTHREAPPARVVEELAALAAQGEVSRGVLVEELISDPRAPRQAPIDYKVHTFYGRVGMIEAKGHGGPLGIDGVRWRVFDPQWRDLGNVFGAPAYDPSLPPPVHRTELLEMASTVSAAVPRAYLRVDLYDDEHGPVFGEITPMPGSPALVPPHVDRMLGELWEEAEARLLLRASRAGILHPSTQPTPEAFAGADLTRASVVPAGPPAPGRAPAGEAAPVVPGGR